MSGTTEGAQRGHASRLGFTADQYQANLAAGLKWCTWCKDWHPRSGFALDRSRSDGLASRCKEAASVVGRRAYKPKPRVTGRRRVSARDGDKLQARRRANYLVELGKLPRPSTVPCVDCGHIGPDRRHEYDHHKGYTPEHHETVEAVCSKCHGARERERRRVREFPRATPT